MAPALGCNVVGYLDAVLGQGESARRFCDGLDAAGVPWAGFALELAVPSARGRTAPRFGTAPFPHRVTVLWCNPDRYGIDIPVDRPLLRDRFTIGRWAWELDRLPDEWRIRSRLLDEIWVSSDFVAQALRPALDVPVVVLPLPIAPTPGLAPLDRTRFGLPANRFLFCFCFDHHSTVGRKNPEGAIAAYRRAFGPGDGAALLVKSVNERSCPAQAATLRRAAAGRHDIRVVDAALPALEQEALLAGCDCYVSLHRSEGFGISMAQAIAHGRPVIATGYGGNLEFMAGDQLLVGHRLCPVGPGVAPYPADGVWAEPDLDHAAALMRAVVDDRAAAAAHGRRAAERLAERHAPQAAGREAADRIEHAHAALAGRDAARQAPAVPRRRRDAAAGPGTET